MPLREQAPSALIVSMAALALAILAGVVIALAGGGGGNAETLHWTPPASTVAAATSLPPATATRGATPKLAKSSTEAQSPTATATARAVLSTPTRRPALTSDSALAGTSVAGMATGTVTPRPLAPLARIVKGPANLRAGPGKQWQVLLIAQEGATFEVTGRTEDGLWLRLCCADGAWVWAAAELFELPAGIRIPVAE